MSTEIDYAPVGIVDDRDTLFTTLRTGELAATLSAVDFGVLTSGRWVIDAQSISGLFRIDYNPLVDTSARLVIANAALLPAAGSPVTITAHYYDRYQVDSYGNPLPGRGFVEALVYTVEAGATRDLDGFGSDLVPGSASSAASPALATLFDGGFAAVWQGQDSAIWAQVRDAAGAARGPAFALTPASDGVPEDQPSVAALAGGRFVTAYTTAVDGQPRIAFKIADIHGNLGAQALLDAASTPDAAMPDVVSLADGGFALAWRAGGQVHVRSFDTGGNPVGAGQVYGSLGTACSPSIAATDAGYTVAWGEIGDGNVYAASQGGAAFVVSGNGLAASVATAAPLPSIAALSGGGYVLAWDSYVNEPYGFTISDIFFQRFDAAGNRVGGMIQANVDSGGGRYDASVSALSGGGFVLSWQSEHGDFDGNGVFGRRFDSSGNAIDMREFAINEMRPGDQAGPALTALANGGFAAAWIDTAASGAVQVEARVLTGGLETAPRGSAWTSDSSNMVVGSSGSQNVDGQGGVDTIGYAGLRQHFSVQLDAGKATVIDQVGGSGTDTLVNVERIAFTDLSLALDIDGTAGQAYRLYTAAFNRTPDKQGVGYWIAMMDAGVTLEQVAAGFTGSAEFMSLYGAQASDSQFVELLYNNVLHRAAEGAGRDYWIKALGEPHTPREQVLAFFSESGENQAQVIGAIQNGIEFAPWG